MIHELINMMPQLNHQQIRYLGNSFKYIFILFILLTIYSFQAEEMMVPPPPPFLLSEFYSQVENTNIDESPYFTNTFDPFLQINKSTNNFIKATSLQFKNTKLIIENDKSIVNNGKVFRIYPRMVHFGKQMDYKPKIKVVKLQNHYEELFIQDIRTNSENNEVSPFTIVGLKSNLNFPIRLRPNEKFQIKIQFLPYETTIIHNKKTLSELHVDTSRGPFIIPLIGKGLKNIYQFRLFTDVIKKGEKMKKNMYIINPSDTEDLYIKEIFSIENYLKLELSINPHNASNYFLKNDKWIIPKNSVDPTKLLDFTYSSNVTGSFCSYVHISTSAGKFLVPLLISVIEPNVYAQPSVVDFDVFTEKHQTKEIPVTLYNTFDYPVVIARMHFPVDPNLELYLSTLDKSALSQEANRNFFHINSNEKVENAMVLVYTTKVIDTYIVKGKVTLFLNNSIKQINASVDIHYTVKIVPGSLSYGRHELVVKNRDEADCLTHRITLHNNFPVPLNIKCMYYKEKQVEFINKKNLVATKNGKWENLNFVFCPHRRSLRYNFVIITNMTVHELVFYNSIYSSIIHSNPMDINFRLLIRNSRMIDIYALKFALIAFDSNFRNSNETLIPHRRRIQNGISIEYLETYYFFLIVFTDEYNHDLKSEHSDNCQFILSAAMCMSRCICNNPKTPEDNFQKIMCRLIKKLKLLLVERKTNKNKGNTAWGFNEIFCSKPGNINNNYHCFDNDTIINLIVSGRTVKIMLHNNLIYLEKCDTSMFLVSTTINNKNSELDTIIPADIRIESNTFKRISGSKYLMPKSIIKDYISTNVTGVKSYMELFCSTSIKIYNRCCMMIIAPTSMPIRFMDYYLDFSIYKIIRNYPGRSKEFLLNGENQTRNLKCLLNFRRNLQTTDTWSDMQDSFFQSKAVVLQQIPFLRRICFDYFKKVKDKSKFAVTNSLGRPASSHLVKYCPINNNEKHKMQAATIIPINRNSYTPKTIHFLENNDGPSQEVFFINNYTKSFSVVRIIKLPIPQNMMFKGYQISNLHHMQSTYNETYFYVLSHQFDVNNNKLLFEIKFASTCKFPKVKATMKLYYIYYNKVKGSSQRTSTLDLVGIISQTKMKYCLKTEKTNYLLEFLVFFLAALIFFIYLYTAKTRCDACNVCLKNKSKPQITLDYCKPVSPLVKHSLLYEPSPFFENVQDTMGYDDEISNKIKIELRQTVGDNNEMEFNYLDNTDVHVEYCPENITRSSDTVLEDEYRLSSAVEALPRSSKEDYNYTYNYHAAESNSRFSIYSYFGQSATMVNISPQNNNLEKGTSITHPCQATIVNTDKSKLSYEISKFKTNIRPESSCSVSTKRQMFQKNPSTSEIQTVDPSIFTKRAGSDEILRFQVEPASRRHSSLDFSAEDRNIKTNIYLSETKRQPTIKKPNHVGHSVQKELLVGANNSEDNLTMSLKNRSDIYTTSSSNEIVTSIARKIIPDLRNATDKNGIFKHKDCREDIHMTAPPTTKLDKKGSCDSERIQDKHEKILKTIISKKVFSRRQPDLGHSKWSALHSYNNDYYVSDANKNMKGHPIFSNGCLLNDKVRKACRSANKNDSVEIEKGRIASPTCNMLFPPDEQNINVVNNSAYSMNSTSLINVDYLTATEKTDFREIIIENDIGTTNYNKHLNISTMDDEYSCLSQEDERMYLVE